MRTALKLMVMGGKAQYYQRVRRLLGASLVAYWPLWESSGATAFDISGNALNGTYKATGITLGEPGIGDGRTSAKFSNGSVNVGNATTKAIIESQELTIIGCAKVTNAGVWGTTNYGDTFKVSVNAANTIEIGKYGSANQFGVIMYSGGVLKAVLQNPYSNTDWFQWAVTISKAADRMILYLDGVPVNAGVTGLGGWAADVTYQFVGGRNAVTDYPWDGWLAHTMMISRPLTGTEVAQIAQPFFSGDWGGADAVVTADGSYNAFPGLVEI